MHGSRSTGLALKPATDGRGDSASHLYSTKDAARNKESQLDYLNGVRVVRAVIGGRPRTVLVDTGSSISLIQPGVCTSEITRASITPFGVTGDELRVNGEQVVLTQLIGKRTPMSSAYVI